MNTLTGIFGGIRRTGVTKMEIILVLFLLVIGSYFVQALLYILLAPIALIMMALGAFSKKGA